MLEVQPYAEADRAEWDAFCDGAVNATVLHRRAFLAYHGERFRDASLLVRENGALLGVLPAAEVPGDGATVASHPGATYGGFVHQGRLLGSRMVEAVQACAAHYLQRGHAALVYKPLPHIYQHRPAQDDLYALFRAGAGRQRCELASAIDLAARGPRSERRRRGLRKALAQVELSANPCQLAVLWDVLADNLRRKHDAAPVHSLAEITQLQALFPGHIVLRCALIAGRVEAGVLFFNTPQVWHAQYIAASERAYDASALDALIEAAIEEAAAAGARYFDFGTSNEQAGQVLNDGLYRFKSEFGGGGVAYEQYRLDLRAPRS